MCKSLNLKYIYAYKKIKIKKIDLLYNKKVNQKYRNGYIRFTFYFRKV